MSANVEWPDLEGCEALIDHVHYPDELHWRQIHPTFIHDGTPSSQVFTPTSKDAGCLSIDRSSVCTAEESYRRYVARRLSSSGVLAVSSIEIANVELRAIDDSNCDDRDPGHGYVDYRPLPKSAAKRSAALLLHSALERGVVFEP